MSVALGISNTSHDSSATVFADGQLVSAVSEERLCRVKCIGGKLPELAIDEALRIAGLARRDVDLIGLMHGFYPRECFRQPLSKGGMARKSDQTSRHLSGKENGNLWSEQVLREIGAPDARFEDCFDCDIFCRIEGFRPDARVSFHRHHAVHAQLAGYYSGFGECMVVTADGYGDLDEVHVSTVYRHGQLEIRAVTAGIGRSPGMFYQSITGLLDFGPLRHEGKVLGLAAYGNPAILLPLLRKGLRVSEDGDTFESDFSNCLNSGQELRAYLAEAIRGHSREDVAAAAQQALEDAFHAIVRKLARQTGLRKLALNGGVAANVKLNQRIAAMPEIDELFVFPAMSDTGNSVGGALCAIERDTPGFLAATGHPLKDVYLGPAYTDAEIESAIRSAGLSYERLDEAALVERTARAIFEGWVIGWFQGRMEFGPRALGNRSLIGRATDAAINKFLNDRLERTDFMPFAPSVLAEYADELFPGVAKAAHAAEFMTVCFDVNPAWRERIPAVVHVDGTARPQLVRKDRNPLYHRVIECYRALSGIPLVLNTSFNVHEEPIVCAPAEAVRALVEDRIDALAIGPFWVDKPRQG